MCGIAGWLDSEMDFYTKGKEIAAVSRTLKSRGPDQKGEYIGRGFALIHRRLAIIDIEKGRQPMTFSYHGRKYTIVYNGELYNTEEIRKELVYAGFQFSGHSDTEAVLKAYIHWGSDVVTKLNGIFAFGIYEEREKTLFLCRDRIGVKPLFFSDYGKGFVFASEIKAIFATGAVKPQIDENGLNEIFFLGPARTCGNGVFKNIEELKPGEYAFLKKGKLTRKTYFKLRARPHTHSPEETEENVRYLLQDAIKRQLVTDKPMCFFLSGGLDSSIIVKTASDYYKEQGKGKISTYSVEYEDNRKYFQKSLFQPTADFEYIGMMSREADTLHREIILSNKDLAEALEDAVYARDLPGMADVDSSLLLFCKKVRENFDVALSGECADELFGGYPWYHNKEILLEDCFPWSKDPSIRRSILRKDVLPKGEEYAREKYLETINSVEKLKTDSPLESRMREMFALNFYWFMQCLLDRKDRCSMYSGLEVRVPFCDYRIVEYAFNMPWEIKALRGREKGIVRKAFEKLLPEEIVWRKKSPYPKTHNPEYMELVSKMAVKALDSGSPISKLLDREGVMSIIENPDKISSPWYGQLMRAPQILAYIAELEMWYEKYQPEILI